MCGCWREPDICGFIRPIVCVVSRLVSKSHMEGMHGSRVLKIGTCHKGAIVSDGSTFLKHGFAWVNSIFTCWF
jgi:hypothetical protein